jgi:hypothetical protein
MTRWPRRLVRKGKVRAEMSRMWCGWGWCTHVKEVVEASTIDVNIGAVEDAQGPGLNAAGSHIAVREDRIGARCSVHLECIRARLEVRGLGLHMSRIDVRSTIELILVEDVVLGRRAVQPHGALRLHEKAAAGVDVDLCLPRIIPAGNLRIDIVVRRPHPDIFKVARGRAGDVHQHVRAHACFPDLAAQLGADVDLHVGARRSAHPEMAVPHPGGTLRVLRHVPLHQDGARGGTLDGEQDVRYLHGRKVARPAEPVGNVMQWSERIHDRNHRWADQTRFVVEAGILTAPQHWGCSHSGRRRLRP